MTHGKRAIETQLKALQERLQALCQWRLDFPQKRRRKIPQLAVWRSAMRWIGASILLRPASALERRWDWRGGKASMASTAPISPRSMPRRVTSRPQKCALAQASIATVFGPRSLMVSSSLGRLTCAKGQFHRSRYRDNDTLAIYLAKRETSVP